LRKKEKREEKERKRKREENERKMTEKTERETEREKDRKKTEKDIKREKKQREKKTEKRERDVNNVFTKEELICLFHVKPKEIAIVKKISTLAQTNFQNLLPFVSKGGQYYRTI
jgi:hypothetical protein